MKFHILRNIWKKAVLFVLLLAVSLCAGACRDSASAVTTLIYANCNIGGTPGPVRAAIDRFNGSHSDVRIEIRDYRNGELAEDGQGLMRLLTEITSGKMPDIIDLGGVDATGRLPYRQLAARGYLEDLWPYIENDPELGRDGLLEAPLRAAEVDGRLCVIFPSVYIRTLTGPQRLVGGRTGWDLQDLMEVYAGMPEDSTILEYSWGRGAVFDLMLSMRLDGYVDWETGESFFDCEDFRAALEFIKSFPETTGSRGLNFMDEVAKRIREGRQMLTNQAVLGMQTVQELDRYFGEAVSFVGYPTEEGKRGSAFVPVEPLLVMSSACADKDAAWELMRQVLTSRYAKQEELAFKNTLDSWPEMPETPVNLADYAAVKKAVTGGALKGKTYFGYGGGGTYRDVTEEEVLRFESLLDRTEQIVLYDKQLEQIVREACGPYFAGDRTLDETIRIIQGSTALYINELR